MKELKITWAAARINASLTQKEVMKYLNITNPTIINWECGRTEPSFSQAQAMAELYGVSLDNISGGTSPRTDKNLRSSAPWKNSADS